MKRFHLLLLALCLNFSSWSQTPSPIEVVLESFITGLNNPVGITNAGDDRLFIVEQHTGRIKIYNSSGVYQATFLDIGSQVTGGSEQGLLGLAFHPQYANNGKFYVNLTNNSGDTEIREYTVSADPNSADASSAVLLLSIDQPFSNHNGGHIAFGPDGYLYIGMGDGGSGGDPQNNAQNNASLLGKMLRIGVLGNGTYFIPGDNPFIGDVGTPDEIWATGLRNPWKFSFDREAGDLWIADVGQNAWEEVNFTPASSTGGENYGWRCYEGLHTYNTSGCAGAGTYTFPVDEYSHSGADGFCSITGGVVYRGSMFESFVGTYFFTDYCDGRIYAYQSDGGGGFTEIIANTNGNFGYVAFGEDSGGEVFIADIGGTIYRLVDPCDDFNPTISLVGGEFEVAGGGVAYWWYQDDVLIPGANAVTYAPTAPGLYYCVVDDGGDCVKQTNTLEYALFGGVPGCTYDAADNYDSQATVDDGTCTFTLVSPCPGDLDSNGLVNTNDLLLFLGAFGQICGE
ncbi:MAG: PQQ-dependent sugar dehydrogenase [Flavobacteriales bacterium]|nr:PQQ-dependent sugar dehydrogenase [Flavobacteriales bacterium]